jgi:hypothetical protein
MAVWETLHPDMQKIATLALELSRVDISLVEGHRPLKRQLALFKKRLTKCDGIVNKSKHNHNPSKAVDFCAYIPGFRSKAYDRVHLTYIAAMFEAAASVLLKRGEITHSIRWGANWDNDGVLVFDQRFLDMPHVELRKI